MFNLKRLINIRLKYRIFEKNFILFRNIITRLYYIIVNLKKINNAFSNKNNKFKNDYKVEIKKFAKSLTRNNNFSFDKKKQ